MKSFATSPDRRAFSLVELLVVIAVIAVLIALLLPALKVAKARAKTTACSNNQRQWGACFYGYVADNNGYYPYSLPECPATLMDNTYHVIWTNQLQGGSCQESWLTFLKPYIGCPAGQTPPSYLSLIHCPSNPWPIPAGDGHMPGSVATASYSMNTSSFPMSWRCNYPFSYYQCSANPASPVGWARRVQVSDIGHPAGDLIVGEIPVWLLSNNNSPPNPPNPWNSWVPYYYGLGACSPTNATSTSYSSAGLCSWPEIIYEWFLPDCNALVSTFHNHGMNALMVDGHVERIAKKTLIDYSVQALSQASSGPNNNPGSIFWTDGKGYLGNFYADPMWYSSQFPGTPYPYY